MMRASFKDVTASRLLAWFLLSTVAVTLLSALVVHANLSALETASDANDLLRLASRRIAADLDAAMEGMIRWSRHLGEDRPEPAAALEGRLDAGARMRLAAFLRRRAATGMVVLDPAGRVALAMGRRGRPELLSSWPEFRRALKGEAVLTDVYTDDAGRTRYVAALAPVRAASGRILGVCALESDMGALDAIMLRGKQQLTTAAFVSLIDERGVRLYNTLSNKRFGFPLVALATADAAQLSAERRYGRATEHMLANATALTTSAGALAELKTDPDRMVFRRQYLLTLDRTGYAVHLRLQTKPWMLSLATAEAPYLAAIQREIALGVLTFLMLLLVSGVGSFAIARWLTAPLAITRRATEGWAMGRFAARIPEYGRNEIGRLADTLNRMAAGLQRHTEGLENLIQERTDSLVKVNEALRHSEGRLAQAQRRVALGHWTFDRSAGALVLSDESLRLFGYQPEPDVTVPFHELVDRIHPEDRAAFVNFLDHPPADGVGRLDFVVSLADGSRRELRALQLGPGPEEHALWVSEGTFQDVTLLRSSEREIQARNAQLQELDRLKSLFFHSISHDLRTPLTAIRGFVEFLEDGVGGPLLPDQRRHLAPIGRACTRLDHLMDDMLDYARLSGGNFELALGEADLATVIREATLGLAPHFERAKLALTVDLPDEPLLLEMDAPRVERVLVNLLQNAVKFTLPGGSVRVGAGEQDGTVWCEVEDSGVGIAPTDLPRLFLHFSQLELGVRQGGTGLGLSICKAIVEAHGGIIGVQSQPERGSVFRFELPKHPAEPEHEPRLAVPARGVADA